MAINLTEANLYGVGRGEAAVWGDNKALGSLRQIQQQEQLRRAKEDAEIQDQVAKVNVDAARNEDLPEIMKRYDGIKSTFAKMRGTTNNNERIKYQADLNQQKAELSRAVNVSKTAAATLKTIGDLRLTHPDEISDEFGPLYKNVVGVSSFDPKFQDLTNELSTKALAPKFDVQKYADGITKRSTEDYKGEIKVQKFGDKHSQWQDQGTRLNEDAVLKNAMNDYTNDKSFRRYINAQYKDLPADEAVKRFAADTYVNYKSSVDKIEPKKLNEYTDDKFYEHEAWKRAHPTATKKELTDGEVQLKDRQQWVEDIVNKVPGSGERLNGIMRGRGYDKNIKVTFDGDYVNLTIPAKTESYIANDSKGNPVTKYKVHDARTVTVNRTKKEDLHKLNALISDVTGENKTPTDFNTLPGKGKRLMTGSTSNPGAITVPKHQSEPKPAATTSPVKSVKRSELAARAAKANYTVQEYEKLVKSKGIKIL